MRHRWGSTRDIGLIVATHGHWDHIGCLAEIKQHTGAPLAMHAANRSSIERPNPVMPPGVTPWGRFLSALLAATVIPRLKIPAATVDVVVPDDGMSLRLRPGLPIFAEDMAQVKRSIEKLLAAGAKAIYPAHGKPFQADVLKAAVAAM